MELVSVIIPTYNGKQHIRETLESVINQSHRHFEILVIDDGSTDGTADAIESIDDRINIIRQDNAGIAGARNKGLSLAVGDYITFLDHDDYWHPYKTERQLQCLRNNPNSGMCFGTFQLWNGGDKSLFVRADINPERVDPQYSGKIYHELILTNHVLLGTALFRRDVIEKVGLFNLDLPPADDWDYAIRAAQVTEFMKLSDPVTLYRQHDGMTSRKVGMKDHETDFRESTIMKYGLSSADGRSAKPREVKLRNYTSALGYAHAHYKKGDPSIAIKSLIRALKFNPYNIEAYVLLLQSWLKKIRIIR